MIRNEKEAMLNEFVAEYDGPTSDLAARGDDGHMREKMDGKRKYESHIRLCEPIKFNPDLISTRCIITHIRATNPRDEGLSGNEVMYPWQVSESKRGNV